ncbi:MAG: cell wall hydrolase [Sphingomonadales bacterium]
MSRFSRTAGFAVASLAVAAVFTAPSRAGDTEGPPVTARYSDHAAIAPVVSYDADNSLSSSALGRNDAAGSAPLAEHVLAPVEAVVSDPGDDVDSAPKSLSQLVNDYATSDVPDAELECLATAVYFESKSEPLAGQLAVAEVLINRAKSGRFPASLCGVVKQRGQFSFVRGGRFPAIPRTSVFWKRAVAIAQIARDGLAEGAAPRALFFHAKRVSPHWRLTRIASVGNHVFYR